ncbi:MAG: adenosine kinase, partial [bacterium]|nr:adenosine kinase [bacterium]
MKKEPPLIVGIGSAIMDLLLQESDEFVSEGRIPKGGQLNVDWKEIDQHLKRSLKQPKIVPGGSACNTIVGLGRLGARARFIATRGKDDLGKQLETDLKKNNVEPCLATDPLPTGQVLSLVTPDAQRTMYTYLGAAAMIAPEHLVADFFKEAAIVHTEAYQLFNEPAFRKVLERAHESGALVSLDLANFTVIDLKRTLLEDVLKDSVDIVIANEDESRALTGLTDEKEAVKKLGETIRTAVVKMGKRGSWICHSGKLTRVGIQGNGDATDTTGAGDLWNSGFLYGLAHD